jgi:hypothetical protein
MEVLLSLTGSSIDCLHVTSCPLQCFRDGQVAFRELFHLLAANIYAPTRTKPVARRVVINDISSANVTLMWKTN